MRNHISHTRLLSSLALALVLVGGCVADPAIEAPKDLANGAVASDAAVGTPPDDASPATADEADAAAATTTAAATNTDTAAPDDAGASDSGPGVATVDSGVGSAVADSSVGSSAPAGLGTSASDAGGATHDSGTSVADTGSAKADSGSSKPDTGSLASDSGTPAAPDAGGTDVGVSSSAVWRTANLTEFTSYPDPGSVECIQYNGCTWAGQFAALNGVQPVSWVQANNIAAVHSKDFATYELKTLRLRQGTKQIDVKVYDECADSDCSGCCTKNSASTGFLIDVESYTAQRFGTSSGIVEWTCLDCK